MVSIWLTAVKAGGESLNMKKIGFAERSRFSSNAAISGRFLLPVLLDAGSTQPGKAMLIDRKLPG
jgi:hypothetical protein